MRTDTLRTYRDLHTWTGIVTGLLLFIAFYAGALTMFKAPLARWAERPPGAAPAIAGDAAAAGAAASAAGDAAAALDGGQRLLERVLAAHPEAGNDLVLTLGGPDLPARAQWRVRGEAGRAAVPATATLAADGSLDRSGRRESGLPKLVDDLHRTGGLPLDEELGAGVMGVVSAVYALALVSGLVVLLPTLVSDLFALRLGRNRKRMWLDAHNVIGLASLPFHLVMALSAVVFGLHDILYDVQDEVVYQGRLQTQWQASGPFASARPDPAPAAMLPLAALAMRAEALSPGFAAESFVLRRAGTAGAAVMVRGQAPCCLQRASFGSAVVLSAVDGRLLNAELLPGRQSGWMAAVSAFFSLHFGNYGGEPVRWGYFLLGLGGAFLFYSGNLVWIETRRRRAARGVAQPPQQRRPVRLMAAATVGVCLGSVIGISAAIVAAKLLAAGFGVATDGGLFAAHYFGFGLACAAAFALGAARAAVLLLRIAALVTLAIPLSSLTGLLVPASGLWARGGAALGVDLVALAGAIGFAAMARATRRRVLAGEADSVWSGS